MCGFVGKYQIQGILQDHSDLEAMLETIVHRGPDSEGRYIDDKLSLGFRRLSIMDTAEGDQPFISRSRDTVVVVNGEIYNHVELRTLLQNAGHHFLTKSDCEVLLHGYEEFGSNFVSRLNGMFAFCIYDQKRGKLVLGRDRVGIKPLYVAQVDGRIVFGSEIKAVLAAGEVKGLRRQGVLPEYLLFRSLSGPRTFFADIDLLPAGCLMKADGSGVEISSYWTMPEAPRKWDQPDLETTLRQAMYDSVERQLMSDVPLGTQLSGGVDSGWVSTIAGRLAPGMKSFTVSFNEPSFDETTEAKSVARAAGLEYHEIPSLPLEFGKSLPKIIWHNDEPLTHANSLEIFNLCGYAREKVKVLLTGEGADELFGGYPRYYLSEGNRHFLKLPRIWRSGVLGLADYLGRNRGRKPSTYLGMSEFDSVLMNASFAPEAKVAALFGLEKVSLEGRSALLGETWRDGVSIVDNLLRFEFRSYLQPILLRQDKMSMGASIEARVPILDNQMVDLAFSLPHRYKLNRMKLKCLFKTAASRDLPAGIVEKRKVGFGVPVGQWMRKGGQLSMYLDHLLDIRNELDGINARQLESYVQDHRVGIGNHEDVLWPLVCYAIWRQVYSL